MRSKIIAIVIGIVFSVLLLEAGLQIYYRLTVHSWLWSYNAFHVTFIDEVPDRRQYALRKGFSDSRLKTTINSHGMRAPVDMPDPDRTAPVIVTLGDSKAFGSGVGDRESYAYVLNTILVSEGSPLQVVNAGVPSYNTRQSLDRFRIDVLPNYNVKLVILEAPFNDISLLTYYRENWDPDKTWADIRYRGYKAPLPLIQTSAIVFYAVKILNSRADDSPAQRAKDVNYSKYPDREMIADLKSELDIFLADCDNRSIPVILLPIDPFYYQTANTEKNPSLPLWNQNQQYVDLWRDNVTHYDDLLAELGRAHRSVHFLDTRKILDAADRSDLFIDAIHYSVKGNLVVAQAINELLKKERLTASQ